LRAYVTLLLTRFFEAVDVGDVAMIQRGEGLYFADESRKPVVVAPKRVEEITPNAVSV
jgi:hypothetical protein